MVDSWSIKLSGMFVLIGSLLIDLSGQLTYFRAIVHFLVFPTC